MDFCDFIKTRRTVRLFRPKPIDQSILRQLLEVARSAPSAANRQPLEYIIVNEPPQLDRIFDQLAWAAYVQPNRNPPAEKRPVAYIVVLINKNLALPKYGNVDAAAAITTILLAAWTMKIGSCWLASVNRDNVREILQIPDEYEIDSVIALGYPDEQPVMEDCSDDSIKYYLDSDDNLHVPKRKIQAVAHLNTFENPLPLP